LTRFTKSRLLPKKGGSWGGRESFVVGGGGGAEEKKFASRWVKGGGIANSLKPKILPIQVGQMGCANGRGPKGRKGDYLRGKKRKKSQS